MRITRVPVEIRTTHLPITSLHITPTCSVFFALFTLFENECDIRLILLWKWRHHVPPKHRKNLPDYMASLPRRPQSSCYRPVCLSTPEFWKLWPEIKIYICSARENVQMQLSTVGPFVWFRNIYSNSPIRPSACPLRSSFRTAERMFLTFDIVEFVEIF
jgi:hypothetical protein